MNNQTGNTFFMLTAGFFIVVAAARAYSNELVVTIIYGMFAILCTAIYE